MIHSGPAQIIMKRLLATLLASGTLIILAGGSAIAQSNQGQTTDTSKEWPTYGHDPGGMRFSPLTQITPANVDRLKVAWVYHMKPAGAAGPAAVRPAWGEPDGLGGGPGDAAGRASARAKSRRSSSMERCICPRRIPASWPWIPTTGKEIWAFQLPAGNPSTRGVEYWPGDAQTPPQIVFGSSDGKLYSLDAKTGKPNEAFGDNGIVNLNTPEILQGLPGRDGLSSPPIVYKNLVITGGTTQENPPKGPAGDVRAWDMHTGKLAWTFHSIPRAGEKYNDTWAGDSWKNRSGVNVWGFITVDAQRGIVYMPFGAPSVDQYGGDRAGDNLFSTSLVAADANTGKYLWHFQVVHHDIWDADMTGAPALIDVKQDGQDHSRRRGDQQDGTAVSARPRHRQADLWRRGASGAAKRGAAGTSIEDPAVPAQTATARADDDERGGHRDRHARVGSGLQEAHRRSATGRALPSGQLQPPARAVPRQPWRGQLGRDVVQSATGLSVRQHQRVGADSPGVKDHDPKAGRASGDGTGNRVDPDGPYEGVPGGGRFSISGSDSHSNCRASSRPGDS